MFDLGPVGILLATIVVLAAAAALFWLLWQRRSRRKGRRLTNPADDYAVRSDWSGSSGTLNYSSFVYFDVDRDGKYGVGDRPMAGIMVRLYDEAGKLAASARTNNAGFANFPMSVKRRKAVIRVPGNWRFAVSVPPGWQAKSENDIQTRHLLSLPGSPAGLVSHGMLQPVGLAPLRRLGGRVAGEGSVTLSVMRNGHVLETRPLAPGAAFSVDLADDADTVLVSGGGLERGLALSPYPADLGLLSAQTACIASDAALETIDFDDVTSRTFRKIPSGHAGLAWRNLNAMARDYTKDSQGYVNGNVSGDHVVYTSSGLPAEFSCEQPFGFHSVMLSAAWLKSEGEVALIESWLGEQLISSDQVMLSALTPLHYAPMLKAVTRVRLSTKHYWQMVLDDLVLTR
ncbi:hypothetical protein ASD12_09560 [Mesorhizobium sp. Root102]|uniref:hypothetical protein n=1 Tax=Mesorhizobium sp. Root102 TaxID=1736422 RepID=UPI0006F5FB19|nr:hypothetical protein [Mesorhizobium sp. Root102]KQU83279.1 hypothetical protein ASD12_09560 [Mesorhizobium sp. Root102]